jgi:hypothetical protein
VEGLLRCELRSGSVNLQAAVRSNLDSAELLDILAREEMVPMQRAELADRSAAVWLLLEQAQLTDRERSMVMLGGRFDGSNESRPVAEVAHQFSCSPGYRRQVVRRARTNLGRTGIESGIVAT